MYGGFFTTYKVSSEPRAVRAGRVQRYAGAGTGRSGYARTARGSGEKFKFTPYPNSRLQMSF